MNGYLTTHVLDTARGCPAAGLKISLYRAVGDRLTLLRQATTNSDGRTDQPILPKEEFDLGEYLLVFETGAYQTSVNQGSKGFYNTIPIRFAITEDDHYHVPLLLSPHGYSTYRGS